ncbi:MAG: head-tail adaptor protein [Pseudomonadota bacterium]
MPAPILNRKLILQDAVRVPDGAGGHVESWENLGVLWADVQARSGREAAGEDVRLSKTGYRIIVRSAPYGAPSRPKPGQCFLEGERLFQIVSVTERDAQQRYLTCLCKEEVAV